MEIRKSGMERAISPLRLCASAGDMILSLAAGTAASVAASLCDALNQASRATRRLHRAWNKAARTRKEGRGERGEF